MKKLLAAGLLGSLSIWAVPLPPGGTLFGPGSPPLLATPAPPYAGSLTAAYSVNGTNSDGIIRQAVLQSGSDFIFYYQIQTEATSTAPITSLLLRGFNGYTISAVTQGLDNPGAPFVDATAGVRPFLVARDPIGNDVTASWVPFGIGPNPPTLAPGVVSSILAITVSNAQGFAILGPGATGALDGSPFNQFAPTPEPSFYVAVSLGLAGLFVARRRKAAAETTQE